MKQENVSGNLDNGQMETRLWEYIDGQASATERAGIEKLLAENTAWKAKYHELLEIHQSLNLIELEEPSMRFTRNVMEEISRLQITPATRQYINQKVIWGIGIFFITTILGFLVYAISQINWTAAGDSEGLFGIDFTRVDYGSIFNNTFVNIFMMLNVVLGLMLLDRYMENRKKKYMQNT